LFDLGSMRLTPPLTIQEPSLANAPALRADARATSARVAEAGVMRDMVPLSLFGTLGTLETPGVPAPRRGTEMLTAARTVVDAVFPR
jgi:hypothetical protein